MGMGVSEICEKCGKLHRGLCKEWKVSLEGEPEKGREVGQARGEKMEPDIKTPSPSKDIPVLQNVTQDKDGHLIFGWGGKRPNSGRPKVYGSNADRQKAYRQRKKGKST